MNNEKIMKIKPKSIKSKVVFLKALITDKHAVRLIKKKKKTQITCKRI